MRRLFNVNLMMHSLFNKLSPHLFWDVDINKLEPDKCPDYIMQRVFDNGTIYDVSYLYAYYGIKKIKEVIINIPDLQTRTAKHLAGVWNIPLSHFKCIRLKEISGNEFI